jgi:HEAT repeat protein
LLVALLLAAPLTPQEPQKARELISQLSAADPETRTRAACGLRELGDDAAPALDALVALLSDGAPVEQSACSRRWSRWNPDNRTSPGEQAASALVSIGSRAVAPLLRTLKSASWIARRHAAWALGALDDRRAGAALIDVLADREAAVREQAAWALGALDEPAAVPALVAALKDQSPRVRSQAAWALGAIDDRRAVDALVQSLADSEGGVRAQASWALGAIGDGRALNALLPALKDPDPGVRRQAAWAIGVLSR